MLKVVLIHVGFEISLAFRNLIAYAKTDPRIAQNVNFCLLEFKMFDFVSQSQRVNDFAPFSASEKALRYLAEIKPDIIGVSCYIWNSEINFSFCERAKVLCPNALVVAGGPDVTYTAEKIMRRWGSLDVIVKGEGEETFKDLLLRILDGREIYGIPGTVTRKPDGTIVEGPPRSPIQNLDVIPFGYDNELQSNDPALAKYDRMLIYETMRGCVYNCAFCLYGRWGGGKSRWFSVERVIHDLSRILTAGYSVQVVDPIFGLDRQRTKEILKALSPLKYEGGLYIEMYAEHLDPETVDLFVSARVKQIGLGLQSLNPKAIEAMGRKSRMERFKKNIMLLGQAKLNYYIDVMYGLPEDTYEGFLQTLDFALSFPEADVEIYRLLVLPGSRYYEEANRFGIVFSPEPPYEVYGSPTFPYNDVLKANRLAQTYRILRKTYKRVRRFEPVWKKKFDNSPSKFLSAFADFLERKNLLDFLNPDKVEIAVFAIPGAMGDFLRGLGLSTALIEPNKGSTT